jgi:hypothetical protein
VKRRKYINTYYIHIKRKKKKVIICITTAAVKNNNNNKNKNGWAYIGRLRVFVPFTFKFLYGLLRKFGKKQIIMIKKTKKVANKKKKINLISVVLPIQKIRSGGFLRGVGVLLFFPSLFIIVTFIITFFFLQIIHFFFPCCFLSFNKKYNIFVYN